ncbi:MAG: hypothetical protein JXQ23_14345, partial [Clostridia bacterium]|nr:hypothetical protein [Clostridia bacterium]
MRPMIAGAKSRQFTGKIIWPGKSTRHNNLYCAFRKKFEMRKAGECHIYLSADTYYNLYIDGSFINRGPVRAYETNYSYDDITLFLNKGIHQIAVLVHYIGKECATHRVASHAFFADIVTDEVIQGTDESYKAITIEAYHDTPQMISHFGFPEDVDMREFPEHWMKIDFDDSKWQNAKVISEVGKDCHLNLTARQLKLFNYVPL